VLQYNLKVEGVYNTSDPVLRRYALTTVDDYCATVDCHITEVRELEPVVALTHEGRKKPSGGDLVGIKINYNDGTEIPSAVKDTADGEYIVEYKPTKEGIIVIDVSLYGIPAKGNPYSVLVTSDGIKPESLLLLDFVLDTPKYEIRVWVQIWKIRKNRNRMDKSF